MCKKKVLLRQIRPQVTCSCREVLSLLSRRNNPFTVALTQPPSVRTTIKQFPQRMLRSKQSYLLFFKSCHENRIVVKKKLLFVAFVVIGLVDAVENDVAVIGLVSQSILE